MPGQPNSVLRLLVGALGGPLLLAVVLAGCPAPEPSAGPESSPLAEPSQDPADPGDPTDPTDRTDPDRDAPDGVVLGESCTNPAYGFRVDYPTGWVVNQSNGLPPCSAFDPSDAGMPAAGEIPSDIAVVIHRDDVSFDRATDFEADFTVNARSRETTTVAGRSAVAAELEHTGAGMYPEGHRHYAYYVDMGGRTLIGITHDVAGAGPPPYPERRRTLDAMMASLRFQE
jgi:hypothetical protein